MSEQDLEKKLDKMVRERITGLKSSTKLAREFAVLNSSLMQREGKRLGKKLGEKHPRVKAMKIREEEILKNLRATEREALKVDDVSPPAKADEAIIEGRILDENRVGVENIKVYLADEKGKKIVGIDEVTTNSNGRYAFTLPGSIIEGEKGKTKPTYRVVVESLAATKIHEEKEGIKLVKGKKKTRDVVINRAKLIRKRC